MVFTKIQFFVWMFCASTIIGYFSYERGYAVGQIEKSNEIQPYAEHMKSLYENMTRSYRECLIERNRLSNDY